MCKIVDAFFTQIHATPVKYSAKIISAVESLKKVFLLCIVGFTTMLFSNAVASCVLSKTVSVTFIPVRSQLIEGKRSEATIDISSIKRLVL